MHDESNGIVESEVNTTKLTKRIMYGKSSFELIKNKTMRLQSLRQQLLERAKFILLLPCEALQCDFEDIMEYKHGVP